MTDTHTTNTLHRSRSPRPPRRIGAAVLTVVTLVLGLLLAGRAPYAHAADNGLWSVFPASSDGKDGAAKKPYFRMRADPGSTIKDKVTISNLAKETVTFLVYGADAYNTPRDGGFAVREKSEKQRTVGRWTRLKHTEVTIPGGEKATVPFTLTIPREATPGDHPGAIVALDKRVARAKGTGFGIRQAVGARVYLQVNGKRTPELDIKDVSFDYEVPLIPGLGDSATISYTLVNSGNTLLEPRVDLKAKGLFGRTSFRSDADRLPAELMPGQSVRVTEKWGAPPPVDWGDLQVTASDDGGELATTAATAYRTVNKVVLTLLLVLLFGGLAGWFLVRRRRRRRRVPAAAGA
ncbi:WxL protein peptidoglycan domain-containing protein [Streptomyces sp. KLOTTS4A1]|uniref:WxL protein peptidoglycan domain-containing protein n=1 Tax=Streptomyces sp. KLOTTS4A1 TaxID=3390996 RepID=UPI0039F61C0A